MSCPSRLRLDEWMGGLRPQPIAAHVESCARCQGRVAELAIERDTFLSRARPTAFADQVFSRRPTSWWRWPMIGAIVAAAAIFLLLRPASAPIEADAYKAGAPSVQLFVRQGETLGRYRPEHVLVRGDRVQIVVLSPRPTHVAVVDVEDGGTSSLLFASDGAIAAGRTPLPQSFELDDWRGGERFVVLFGDGPIDTPIERARRGEGTPFPILRCPAAATCPR